MARAYLTSWMLTWKHLQAICIDLKCFFWLAFQEKNFGTAHVSLEDRQIYVHDLQLEYLLAHPPWRS